MLYVVVHVGHAAAADPAVMREGRLGLLALLAGAPTPRRRAPTIVLRRCVAVARVGHDGTAQAVGGVEEEPRGEDRQRQQGVAGGLLPARQEDRVEHPHREAAAGGHQGDEDLRDGLSF